jgi:hypothetical protein
MHIVDGIGDHIVETLRITKAGLVVDGVETLLFLVLDEALEFEDLLAFLLANIDGEGFPLLPYQCTKIHNKNI